MNVLFFASFLLAVGLTAVRCNEGEPQDDCLYVCTKEYEPVCGRSSAGEYKTFSSLCFLYFENCRDKTDYDLQGEGDCSDYTAEVNEASPSGGGGAKTIMQTI